MAVRLFSPMEISMARSIFVIVIAFLAAGSPGVCLAQDPANKPTWEEWQSRVNANRERLQGSEKR